jgi:hypothetical protein
VRRLFRKSELAQTFRICGRAAPRQRRYLTITPQSGRRNVGTRTSSILLIGADGSIFKSVDLELL